MASVRSGFPLIVDEITVRLVAAVVLVVGIAGLLTGAWWLYAALATDFTLRVWLGPAWSPIARLVTGAIRPRLEVAPRPTPGAPKRFAASIGAVLAAGAAITTGAAALGSATGAAGFVLGSLLVVFPALEAAAGICVGCVLFGRLIRLGLVPDRICMECADITQRAATVRA